MHWLTVRELVSREKKADAHKGLSSTELSEGKTFRPLWSTRV